MALIRALVADRQRADCSKSDYASFARRVKLVYGLTTSEFQVSDSLLVHLCVQHRTETVSQKVFNFEVV